MLWTLIPAKSFHQSKQRLAPILSDGQRAELGAAMLSRTIRVAREALGAQPILVVADAAEVGSVALSAGADKCMHATSRGLNPQLAQAAGEVPGGEALLVLHADLPLLQAADLAALVAQTSAVVMAPDNAGEGTNALLQRQPARFFAFGEGSRAHHQAAAQQQNLSITLVRRAGLSHDLDDADDWQMLEKSLCGEGGQLGFDRLLAYLSHSN